MRLLGVAGLAALLWMSGLAHRPQTAEATQGESVVIGGPFTLTAPDGHRVSDADFRGKWLLVFFGYTFCPSICPTTLGQVSVALVELGSDAVQVQPIFITVDPERDTPEVMGAYAAAFDDRILALSGSKSDIDAVMEAYGAYGVRREIAGHPYLMEHSTYLYAMTPQGAFARGFDSEATGAEIAAELRTLIAAASE